MATSKKIIFYGTKTDVSFATDTSVDSYLDTHIKSSFEVGSQRSHAFQNSIEVTDNDIIELEFDNGFVRMMTLAQLEEEFPEQQKRSGESELQENEIGLPIFIEGEEHSRGFFKNILRKFRIISVGEELADMAAIEIVRKIENKLKLDEGLYYCANPNHLQKKAVDLTADAPILVLLHGTASNTQGSFGGLMPNDIPSAAWLALQAKYNDRIVAFEHKTLSKSPLQNALHLLKIIPEKSIVHLLSHSRGGLIGEILSRNLIDRPDAFSEADFKVFEEQDRIEDIETAKKINELFREKKIKVEKFVRVACPTSGTTLASKRLDHYFTVSLNLLGLIPILRASPIYSYVKSFLIAFVKKKVDIKIVPGLESMMPSAPLIKVLNHAEHKIASELFIISGDVKAHGIKHSLAVMLTDIFYRTQHDFVVNTASMFGGCRRDQMQYVFYSNKDISHFNYFTNKTSQNHIAHALTGLKTEDVGYKPLDNYLLKNFTTNKVRGILNYVDTTVSFDPTIPVVYVIPGIMGSTLKVDGDRVWVHPLRLALGGMDRLKMDTKDVAPHQLMGSAYKSLIKALREKNNVVPFPYDWRTSIVESGNLLAQDIEARMQQTEQPIRLMAHSMGGLVVHAFYSMPEHKKTWDALMSRHGSRIIFLGSPLRGSHVIPSVFMKKDRFFKLLHSIDFTNTSTEILEIIKEYSGLLELLPMGGEHDYFDMKIWDQLENSEKSFVKPLKKALEQASKLQQLFEKRPIQGDGVIYIAGKDRCTPCKLEFKYKKPVMMATSAGDGRVTWETGIPKNLLNSTWYMDVTHGKLCASKDDFPALFELLETGFTQLLANKPIAYRGETKIFEMPEETPLAIHTEGALEYAIMGVDPNLKLEEPQVNIFVEVCHGDLGNAKYPVAVGHHLGDPIVSAESALDHYMNYRLSKNKALDVYPGHLETSLVLYNEEASFKGAIILGLGTYGDLNEGRLMRSFSRALLDYAVSSTHTDKKGLKKETILGVSALLIGSDYSGLPIRNSIRAMLQGVLQANKIIKTMNDPAIPSIGNIEFIEIFKDRAIQATHEVLKVIREPIFIEKIICEHPFIKEVSGRRRRIPGERSSAWWNRLKIQGEGIEKNPPLKFISLTDKARAEEEIKPTQRILIDTLIESSVKTYEWNEENARTLFHLLIPNDFKDYATDNKNILLILDQKSAEYPWEILHLYNVKHNEPLVTQIGLIRQLITNEYDKIVTSTIENSILVVGNPNTSPKENYPSLPHAEEEARAVAKIFEEKLFTTVVSIKDPGVSVVNKLFGNNYKVIHLAGHGIIDEDRMNRTGMVLDQDMFITASEIDALPQTPELVFINCCYLGKKVDVETKFNKLAANVGTQFIRKGVKAVVAAGWAIDDAAAKHFAEVLYNRLFEGEIFGEAVRLARLSTYTNYSTSNTWGAYQCYGDPYYRLIKEKKSHTNKTTVFVDPLEAIVALKNITSKAEPASSRNRKDLKSKLLNVVKLIPSKWLENSKVVEAIANCFYELNQYDEAIKYYKKLSYLIDGQTTLEGMLRLANIQTKVAVKKLMISQIIDTERKEAEKLIEYSEGIIDNLLGIGENSRRYSTKGGHYKRKSLIIKNNISIPEQYDFIKECLETSLKSYYTATKFIADQQIDYYAIINWATMEIMYKFYGGERKVSLQNAIKKIEWLRLNFNNIDDTEDEPRSFWYYIFPAALGIYDILDIKIKGNERMDLVDEVIGVYELYWSKGGSVRKSENILGQVRFLIAILTRRLDFKFSRNDGIKIKEMINAFKKLSKELDRVFNKN